MAVNTHSAIYSTLFFILPCIVLWLSWPRSSMVLTLYTNPLAYFPARAKLILVEKKLPHETVKINLFTGQNLSPEYIKVNPKATCPALRDGDLLLTDSRAIVEYIDTKKGEPLGGDVVDRSFIEEWVDQVAPWDGNLFMAVSMDEGVKKTVEALSEFKIKYAEARAKENPELEGLYQQKISAIMGAKEAETDAAKIEENRKELTAILDKAESRLTSSKFIAGDEYSLADVLFTPLLVRVTAAKKAAEWIEPRPKVAAYYEMMKARPSFNEVFGATFSGFATAAQILPAILKSKWANFRNHY